MSKIGQALAWLATGLVLALGHYAANIAQAGPAKLAIRFLVGPLPALFLFGALILVRFYPLDEKTYASVLAGAGAANRR